MLASFKRGGIYLIEGDLLVGVVKQTRLAAAQVIEVRVHTTPLNDVPEVEIRLSVAYEVNFFTDQFLHYFVAAAGRAQK